MSERLPGVRCEIGTRLDPCRDGCHKHAKESAAVEPSPDKFGAAVESPHRTCSAKPGSCGDCIHATLVLWTLSGYAIRDL